MYEMMSVSANVRMEGAVRMEETWKGDLVRVGGVFWTRVRRDVG